MPEMTDQFGFLAPRPAPAAAAGRHLGMVAWIFDLARNRIQWRDALDASFRGPESPSYETHFADFLNGIHPEDRQRVEAAMRSAALHGTDCDITFRQEDAEVGVRWWNSRGRAQCTPDGTIQSVSGLATDVTSQHRTEEALRRSEEQYRQLIDMAEEGVWVIDADNRTTFVNPKMARMLGYTPEEMMGREVFAFMDEEGARLTRENIERRRRGIREHHDFQFLTRTGEPLWALLATSPIFDAGGQYIGALAMVTDITIYKQAEAAVRDSEARYRHLFDHNPQSMWVYDLQTHHILAVNEAAAAQYGYTREELLGMTILDLRPPSAHEAMRHAVDEAGRLGYHYSGEWQHLRKNGVVIDVDITSYGMTFAGRSARLVLSTDITARKRADQQIRQLARDLDAANRQKDNFLALVSHELRTPITAIRLWSRLLLDRDADEQTAGEAIDMIDRSIAAQAQLIDDLLDVSRIITGTFRIERQVVPLAPIVSAAVEMLRPVARENEIALSVSCQNDGMHLLGDPKRLQQMLWNLLSNGLKFTPPGGSVQLTVDQAGNQARLVIRDTGQGINPDFLPYAFDRFRQADSSTSRKHGGLGLGLTIVKHLVDLHGGEITLDSEGEGKGTTATLMLPLHVESSGTEPGAPAAVAQRAAKRPLEGISILVVDDQLETRRALALLLSRYGAVATAAGSAVEALQALDRQRPDVLVSDIGMPGEDGYSLMRKIRAADAQAGSHLSAIAVTAYTTADDRDRALKAGFDAYLPKPIEAEQLVRMIGLLASAR
jgi:PAS domain S-box-containing protein